jgi:hypothetical protein
MVAGLLVIKFLLPECCGRGNSIFMPFLWPVLLDIRDAFTGIKEESGGVYENLSDIKVNRVYCLILSQSKDL